MKATADSGARPIGCDCDNCRGGDLPLRPFLAPRVAYGMLLGEDDFRTVTGYPRGKHLIHQAWLHGSGVVWGYGVRNKGLYELQVDPGLAIDPIGREVRREAGDPIDLREFRDLVVKEGDLEEGGKAGDGRTKTIRACVVAEFEGCLTTPVPTLADPCDVNRSHDDYSRVLERARVTVRRGSHQDPWQDRYQRVRVLLGLPVADAPTAAVEEAERARDRVLAAADPARELERQLQEMACRDGLENYPYRDKEDGYGFFPEAEEDVAVVLADLEIKLRDRDGNWEFAEAPSINECARTTLLPTRVITALTCGLAPALMNRAAEADTHGPRVDTARVTFAGSRKLIIPVDSALVEGTVPGSVEITTLARDNGDRWVVEDIYDVAYDGQAQAIVVSLAYSLAEHRPPGALVRVLVRGTGGKPVMGEDPLLPLAGVVGGPPGSPQDGRDAVWAFVNRAPGYDDEEVSR